jgi:hypothetical protein
MLLRIVFRTTLLRTILLRTIPRRTTLLRAQHREITTNTVVTLFHARRHGIIVPLTLFL